MTDLEITKLCAEAMGWKYLGAAGVDLVAEGVTSGSEADKRFPKSLWCLSGGNDWWLDPEGHHVCGKCSFNFDPLHDDAQAMALVKKFRLCVGYNQGWSAGVDEPYCRTFHYPELNRAICLCVAQMQAAK